MFKEKLRLTKKGVIADDGYKGPVINVTLYPVGSQPTRVAAEWQVEGTTLSGIAFGGFQRHEDFCYETARKLAIDNAISMARL